MQDINLKMLRWPLTVLVLSVIALSITSTMYLGRSNAYKSPKTNGSTTSITATNPEVLLNWMPQSTYKFTMSRLQDYVNNKSLNYTTFTFGSVSIDAAKYKFNVTMNPGNGLHTITVEPINYEGTLTAAVSVDGVVQGVTSTDNSDGSGFVGFDELTDQGLTSFQYKGLQKAFTTFDTTLRYAAIDTDTILNNTTDDANQKSYFTFTVSVDGKKYSAKALYWDITKVRLYLTDVSNAKQAFDSGDIDVSE